MKREHFQQLLKRRLTDIENTEEIKATQYAPVDDRLCHFKDLAQLDGITPEQALWDLWKKHIITVKYMVQGIAKGKLPTRELLDEITRDNAFYPILLEGLITERIGSIE